MDLLCSVFCNGGMLAELSSRLHVNMPSISVNAKSKRTVGRQIGSQRVTWSQINLSIIVFSTFTTFLNVVLVRIDIYWICFLLGENMLFE